MIFDPSLPRERIELVKFVETVLIVGTARNPKAEDQKKDEGGEGEKFDGTSSFRVHSWRGGFRAIDCRVRVCEASTNRLLQTCV